MIRGGMRDDGGRPKPRRPASWLGGLVGLVVLSGCISAPIRAPHFIAAGPKAPRTLLIVLDAVPFAPARAAVEEDGLLSDLEPPVPMISSFPSATTLALTGVFEPLGMASPPGYEAKFFDWQKGKVRGGGLMTYEKISFSWREIFHWKTRSLLRKALGYLRPIKLARYEIDHGIEAFLESDEPLFLVYVGATDGVAHLKGPEGFAPVFAELDRALAAAHQKEDFYTVVMSDHGVGGGERLRNVRKPLRRVLADAGFSAGKRVRSARDVALVPFGLLSSLVAFAAPGQSEKLASTLARVDGISVCAYRERPSDDGAVDQSPTDPDHSGENFDRDRWWVVGSEGRARIERRRANGEASWRYVEETGDPIGYHDLAGTWRSGAEWAERTLALPLPDVLHRVARTFDLVHNVATTVCSTSPGYDYGAGMTEWASRLSVGRLRWTHGALERDDSLGFFATDHPGWRPRPGVRFDHVLRFLSPQAPPEVWIDAED